PPRPPGRRSWAARRARPRTRRGRRRRRTRPLRPSSGRAARGAAGSASCGRPKRAPDYPSPVTLSMISERDQQYIRDLFAEKLTGDVTIELVTRKRSAIVVPGREECAYCAETEQLLREVADLSDRVTLNVDYEGGDPSLVP